MQLIPFLNLSNQNFNEVLPCFRELYFTKRTNIPSCPSSVVIPLPDTLWRGNRDVDLNMSTSAVPFQTSSKMEPFMSCPAPSAQSVGCSPLQSPCGLSQLLSSVVRESASLSIEPGRDGPRPRPWRSPFQTNKVCWRPLKQLKLSPLTQGWGWGGDGGCNPLILTSFPQWIPDTPPPSTPSVSQWKIWPWIWHQVSLRKASVQTSCLGYLAPETILCGHLILVTARPLSVWTDFVSYIFTPLSGPARLLERYWIVESDHLGLKHIDSLKSVNLIVSSVRLGYPFISEWKLPMTL